MKVTATQFTVAEYCEQFARKEIRVNHDYQRSNKVWPTSARSYLIDSVLLDYPIAKILLRQHTDLIHRTTIKEVIDGQQRTQAIFDFYNDKFSISLRSSRFFGKRFTSLNADEQHAFLAYGISADIFSASTDEEIREIFRRMNSYTVPLNKQELRHATHQGPFKWFVLGLTSQYSERLKSLKVISESQISRMGDAEFFTNVLAAMENGIETGSPSKLDNLYKKYDADFPHQAAYQRFIDSAFAEVISFEDLIRITKLSARHHFYSLLLALGNARSPIPSLEGLLDLDRTKLLASRTIAQENLSALISAVEEWETRKEESGRERTKPHGPFAEFVSASVEGTNTKLTRERRFKWISRALLPEPLPLR